MPAGPTTYSAVQTLRASRGFDADEMLGRALDLLELYSRGGRTPAARRLRRNRHRLVSVAAAFAASRRSQPGVDHRRQPMVEPQDCCGDHARPALESRTRGRRSATGSRLDSRAVDPTAGGALAGCVARRQRHRLPLPGGCAGARLGDFERRCHPQLQRPRARGRCRSGQTTCRSETGAAAGCSRRAPLQSAGSFRPGDASITGANFLQFSASQWRRLGGEGLAPHNRLRCVQHARLVEDAGLDIVVSRTRHDERARVAIESGALTVHPDFAGMSPSQLSDDYMWLVARAVKPPPVPLETTLG